MARQAPLDNQVFRVRIKVRTSDKSYVIYTYGPYAKIGAARGELRSQLKGWSLYQPEARATGKVEILKGEWAEVE